MMGSSASVSDDTEKTAVLQRKVNDLVPHLPVAELMNGGIIRLTGFVGFFNPDSLLEPSWLKGKMTEEEYKQAINHVNTSVVESQADFAAIVNIYDFTNRHGAIEQAAKTAVDDINKKTGSVRFTYQSGAKQMVVMPYWHPGVYTELTTHRSGLNWNGYESYLYININ